MEHNNILLFTVITNSFIKPDLFDNRIIKNFEISIRYKMYNQAINIYIWYSYRIVTRMWIIYSQYGTVNILRITLYHAPKLQWYRHDMISYTAKNGCAIVYYVTINILPTAKLYAPWKFAKQYYFCHWPFSSRQHDDVKFRACSF